MKNFLITLLSLLLTKSIVAQNFQVSVPFDHPARGIDIIRLNDGFLVTGNTFSPTERKANMFLIKLNPNGELIWQKEISNPKKSYYGWSLVDMEESVMILGFSESGESTKALLVKADKNGNVIWEKELGQSAKSIGWNIIPNDNTELVGVGETTNDYGTTSVWLFKLDKEGNLIDQWVSNTPYSERAFYMDQLENGDIVVAGTHTEGDKKVSDVLVRCFDKKLNERWKKVIDIGGKRDVAHALRTYGNEIEVYGYYQVAEEQFNPMVIRMDVNGGVKKTFTPEFLNADIRIMNGAGIQNGHLLIGYSRELDEKFAKASLIEIDNTGKILNNILQGEVGLNNFYGLKQFGNTILLVGAITEDAEKGKSEVLVRCERIQQ
jgi:hypothetical protein